MAECSHNCSSCGSNCSERKEPQDMREKPHKGINIKKVTNATSTPCSSIMSGFYYISISDFRVSVDSTYSITFLHKKM